MNIFAGKSPTERNKIIAASVLGIMALFALYLAFGGNLFSRTTSINVKASPSPSPSASPNQANLTPISVPDDEAILREWTSTPIDYRVDSFYAPDAGRNIFAFYEPPPPTPYSPTPLPTEKPAVYVLPTPAPTPPIYVTFINPQSVYAGSKTFRLQVNGERFTPDSQILFNGSSLPTTFVSENQLYADVPANLISGEGARQISVITPDGRLFSNQFLLNVQAPPLPQFQYLGVVARKRYNNDTAYIKEQGKTDPTAARLNDVIEGRFKLLSISPKELVVEDLTLGFRHKVALVSETASTGGGIRPNGGNTYVPYTPPVNQNPAQIQNPQNIPGIPNNIQPYNPAQTRPNPNEKKTPDNVDDSDTDDGDN